MKPFNDLDNSLQILLLEYSNEMEITPQTLYRNIVVCLANHSIEYTSAEFDISIPIINLICIDNNNPIY